MDGVTTALASAMTSATDTVATHGASSWVGLFAKVVLAVLQFVSAVLYFVIKLATISLPTLLFTLFSTTLTVTLNATTL